MFYFVFFFRIAWVGLMMVIDVGVAFKTVSGNDGSVMRYAC